METKANEETTGEWVELTGPIGSCGNCTHNAKCIELKSQVTRCTEAKYRFRCPIEVFVPEGVQHG